MDWFFALEGEAPQELWTPVFSRTHLLWLSAVALICAAVTIWFRRQKPETKTIVLKSCIWIAVGSELVRNLWLIFVGKFDISYMLPLHLCGAMLFVELAAIYTKKPLLMELCYCLGLPGALSALLTPGVTDFPMWNLMYLQFILAHSVLFLIPVLLLADGFRPDYRQLPKCFLSLLLLAVFDSLTNFILNSNYLFLRGSSPDSLLEVIERTAGTLYLPAVMCFVWLVWAVFYLPWPAVRKLRSQLKKASASSSTPQTPAPNQSALIGYVRKIAQAARVRLHS